MVDLVVACGVRGEARVLNNIKINSTDPLIISEREEEGKRDPRHK
jgi:hypothetical protein